MSQPLPHKNRYLIKGIQTGKGPDGKWPPRRNIDDLIKNHEKQFVLFIVAYHKLQERSLDETLSYYQIAGIHGYPRRTWPTEGGPKAGEKSIGFYCVHSHYTFLTWHRVYMLLIEQVLHEIIMDLVKMKDGYTELKDRIMAGDINEWVKEAETWRLPYWDPAVLREYNDGKCSIPQLAEFEKLNLPDLPQEYPNPLYSYSYPLPPGDKLENHWMEDVYDGRTNDIVVPATKQKRSVRYAPSFVEGDKTIEKIWADGTSDIAKLKEQFRNFSKTLREDLSSAMSLLHTFKNWGGSKEQDTPVPTGDKIEKLLPHIDAVHAFIHDIVGGDLSSWSKEQPTPTNGNMAWLALSGFDPIFFLWHAGVDRWFAMYQAGHPDESNPDYWLPSSQDHDPLYPFIRDAEPKPEWWVSAKCRHLADIGYGYEIVDEINAEPGLSPEDRLKSVAVRHYGAYRPAKDELRLDYTQHQKQDAKHGLLVDYICTARYESNQIGPFRLIITIQGVDGVTYEVGRIINFVAHPEAGCENCQRNQAERVVTVASTHISPAIRDLVAEKKVVVEGNFEAYLAQNLKWKVYNMRGKEIESLSTEFSSLTVVVTELQKRVVPDISDGARGGHGLKGHFDVEDGIQLTKVVKSTILTSVTADKDGGLQEQT